MHNVRCVSKTLSATIQSKFDVILNKIDNYLPVSFHYRDRLWTMSGAGGIRSPLICKYCHQYFADFNRLRTHVRNHRRKYRYKPSTFASEMPTCFPELYSDTGQIPVLPNAVKLSSDHATGLPGWLPGESSLVPDVSDATNYCPVPMLLYQKIDFDDLPSTTVVEVPPSSSRKNVRNKKPKKIKPTNFDCPYCGTTFKQKSHLIGHIRRHTKEKPYECEYCGKRFPVSGTLTRHIRTHTKENPYHCSMCEKKFAQKGALTRHMRTHTKEKPFECPKCLQRFYEKAHMTVHIRIHTRERPFSCPEPDCGKAFACKSTLKRHSRVHVKGPYLCLLCNKAYVRKNLFTRHMKQTHNSDVGEEPDGLLMDDSQQESTQSGTVMEESAVVSSDFASPVDLPLNVFPVKVEADAETGM